MFQSFQATHARHVDIGKDQHRFMLNALIGYSPNKFICIVRLNKAKELLKKSTASIAMDCGFNDPGHFARVFKQETGITPQNWRVENMKI